MIFFAVILYNKELSDSNSLSCLYNENPNDNSKIIVFDNSSDLKIKDKNQINVDSKLVYLKSNSGNIGISKAYNLIVDYLWGIGAKSTDYLCLLDDDTILNAEYFYQIDKLMMKNVDIIFPIIVGQDSKVYSPNNWGYMKNAGLNLNNKNIDIRKVNAINSCLTLKMNIFNNFQYNEKLFLDQVDQLFFDSLRGKGYSYGLADVIIHQNFSQRNTISGKSYLERFKLRTKDLIMYGKLSPYNNVPLCYLKNIILGLSMSFKAHDLAYLFVGFKSIKYWKVK